MARGAASRRRRSTRRAHAMGIDRQGAQSAPAEDPLATATSSPLLERLARRAELRELATTPLPLSEEDEALARMEEQLQALPACAGCDHAYADHEGPCALEECSCAGYEAPDAEPDEDPDDEAAYAPSDELALALRVVSGIAADDERAAEYVRVNLDGFAVSQRVTFAADPVTESLPAEHQPGSREPARQPVPAVPAATVIPGPLEWSAIFAPEGRLTSDRRAFAPGSITWRDLPLTLMAMIETSEGGHVGAQVSGRIDRIWRDETASLIRGAGIFDDGDYGAMIADLVTDETLRGVSVDLAISKYETGPVGDYFDEDGRWSPKETADAEPPSLIDLYSDDVIAVVLAAEIGMVTVCPFPAFAEARIAMGDSLVAGANPAFWTVTQQAGWTVERCESCGDAVVESSDPDELLAAMGDAFAESLTAAAAGLVPEKPPAIWFTDPCLDEPTPLTIDDDGRVYGHAAVWNVCHLGMPGTCRTAPHSSTGYALFHLGEILCEEGGRVACGQITLDTGHADRALRAADATAHYDETGTVVAHVVAGEDEFGIWVAGALQPDAPAEKVRLLRGAKLSGDWRKVDGSFELVALLAVNVPGFPVPRASAQFSLEAGEAAPEPISLVAAGIPIFDAELSDDEREAFAVLQAEWIRAELKAA